MLTKYHRGIEFHIASTILQEIPAVGRIRRRPGEIRGNGERCEIVCLMGDHVTVTAYHVTCAAAVSLQRRLLVDKHGITSVIGCADSDDGWCK